METTSGSGAGPEPPVAAQPPPSPLSGAYLLIVVGEPHTDAHKQDILRKIANGFLSWDVDSCHVDLDKELQAIISAAPEGEEARNGERLIQFASENLVTEVLIQPQLNTLIQCIRNLLSSFTKHRHIIHAGYTFAGNGSWIVQDGTFSLADLIDALQETEVQRVLRAYEHSVTVDIHCAPEGDWSTARLRREACTRLCRVRVNPDDGPSPAANIQQFVDYLAPFVQPQSIDKLLHPSDVVGNIRFSHPTLYVFPGGQGDAALFGINGFNMLVDGGFARKACFWDFVRHLDRLDAVLMTRINNSNCHGLSSILRRKRLSHVYPQIGHFFCNLQERKQPSTPDEEKVRDPLLVSLLDEGQEMVQNLKHLQLKPHNCVRDSVLEPINLYHKVGHGKLDMYVISPSRDSKELKEFLSKWNSNDVSMFNSVSRKPGDKDISFPFQNLVSICALLVWQPANPEDTITRILFPGSTPQHKIFEGLEKLRSLDFMKQPVCTAKTLSPSSSTTGISTKVTKTKSTPAVIDKLVPGEGLSKPISKGITQADSVGKQAVAKTSTIPVSGSGETKIKTTQPAPPKTVKQKQEKLKVEKDNKTEVDKNIEADATDNVKQDKPLLITDQLKEKESIKMKNEKTKAENKPKKTESKITSRISEKKPAKVPSVEKKDSVKSSPTTPKKSVESKMNGVASKTEIVKSTPKPRLKTSPSSTPAKSTKEENNRKVVESKAKAAITSKPTAPRQSKKDDNVVKQKLDKKPIKKTLSSSPVKLPSKSFSPVKSASKTLSKTKRDSKKLKGEIEKGIVTDSSAVSTPSTVDAETAITKEEKVELKEKTNGLVEKDVDSGKFEENEKVEDDTSKDIDTSVEVKNKAEEASVSEDVASVEKPEEHRIETSEKDYSEKEEEDEILIIEKVEIEQYGDDSVQDQESLESHVPDDGEDEIQKHLRDEAESEKKKDDQPKTEECQDIEENDVVLHDDQIEKGTLLEEKDISEPAKPSDLPLSLVKEISTEKVMTPENREQIEEEVQDIITSATDFVAKAKLEQSKESSELSADGIGSDEQKTSGETKDLLSSPEKFPGLSDKNLTDDDNKQDDLKDRSKEIGDVRYAAEESQPDEKMSTTVESGATTAPTLPEDERIPLDEIKEGIEEKYDKEDTKEKEIGALSGRIEQPTTLPQVSIVPGGPYEVQASQILRDIVKTPDEVADLPVHEEVDGLYEEEDFSRDQSKSKEDLLNISGKKDMDTKEDTKEGLTENKNVLEAHEQIKKPDTVLAEDDAKEKEIQTKDAKTDNEELNELTNIRQKLEAEDLKQEQIEADQKLLSKGLDLESKHEMVLETEPVHSMLKAPEVAELVMVTPDSAPESPLHLLTEKKDKLDDKPTIDAASKTDESPPTIKHGEIEESLDIVMDLKKPISSPKTPPASPILEDFTKEKDQINVIPEVTELSEISKDVIGSHEAQETLDATKLKTDQKPILESASLIKPEELDNIITQATKDRVEFDNQLVSEMNKVVLEDETKSVDIISHETELPSIPEKEIDSFEKSTDVQESDVKYQDAGNSKSNVSELPDKLTTCSDIKSDPQKSQEEELLVDKSKSLDRVGPLVAEGLGESPKLDQEQTVNEKLETEKCISPEEIIIAEGDDQSSKKGAEEATKAQPSDLGSLLTNTDKIFPEDTGKTDKQEAPEDRPVEQSKLLDKGATVLDKDDSPKAIGFVSQERSEEKAEEGNLPVTEIHGITQATNVPSKQENETSHLEEGDTLPLSIDNKQDSKQTQNVKIEAEKLPSSIEKVETYKSTSPLSIDTGASKTEELEQSEETKTGSPKSPLPSSEKGDSKHSTPKSVSPTLYEKEDIVRDAKKSHAGEDENSILEKHISPKSISPVPSEERHGITIDGDQTIQEKSVTPKSISPVPSEKRDSVINDKDITMQEKSVTPKSISPVPSEKRDSVINDKDLTLQEKSVTPTSISPVPSEKRESVINDKDLTMQDKSVTPKSISPVPSEKRDSAINDKDLTMQEKSVTPKSISPVPSEKRDSVLNDKDLTMLEKSVTPKSISPAPSEKRDSVVNDKDLTMLEKSVTPKSISPVPSEKRDSVVNDKDLTMQDKPITPKSTSPVPSEKRDSVINDKDLPMQEKSVTPKSISPVPSEKRDSVINDKDLTMQDKSVTPKSISPAPSEKEADEKEKTKLDTQVSPKSVSPVHSEKRDSISHDLCQQMDSIPQDKEQPIENLATPKSISPVISEKGDTVTDGKKQYSLEKHDSPKSVSPVPSDKSDSIPENKKQTDLEKPVSEKSVSPEPSTKGDIVTDDKAQAVLEKQSSSKSASPSPTEKEDSNVHDKEQSLQEKPISPNIINQESLEKEAVKCDEKEQPTSVKNTFLESEIPLSAKEISSVTTSEEQSVTEKSVSTKSISPVPAEKGDSSSDTKEQNIIEKQTPPKSVSPVSSERIDTIPQDKEETIPEKGGSSDVPDKMEIVADGKEQVNLEKQVSQKSITSVYSEKTDSISDDKEKTDLEKKTSPLQSLSPVPSEKEVSAQTVLEKQSSPKGVSPEPTEKKESFPRDKEPGEKQISPKSISPTQSETGVTLSDRIEKTILEEQTSPKSVTPVPVEKEDNITHTKEQNTVQESVSPQSISPVPLEKEDSKSDGKESTLMEKHLSPKSVSPVPSEKVEVVSEKVEVVSDGKESTCLEKEGSPKGVSPVPSEEKDTILLGNDQTILQKGSIEVSPKSISPVPSEKAETLSDGKVLTMLENIATPKSISPVPSEKEDFVCQSKQPDSSQKLDTPKRLSPVQSEKEVIDDHKEQVVVEDSLIQKSISPLLSEKEDNIASSKSMSPELSVRVLDEKTELQTTILEKHDTPKASSPVHSGEGGDQKPRKEETSFDNQDSPKSVSPLPVDSVDKGKEKGETILEKHGSPDIKENGKEHEQTLLETQGGAKSVSPIYTKEQTFCGTIETPKSLSPVPSEGQSGGKEQAPTDKVDSPKSISPVPSDKGENKVDEKARESSEKLEISKSISPTHSDHGELNLGDKATLDSVKQESPKSISPVPSDKEVKIAEKELSGSEKHDSPKSISPLPSDKEDTKGLVKETGCEKQDTPKSISPLPSDKDSSEPSEKELSLKDVPVPSKDVISVKSDVTDIKQSESPSSHSDMVSSKTSSVSVTETEKADTELSEKEKDKIILATVLKEASSTVELQSGQGTGVTHSQEQEENIISSKLTEPEEKNLKSNLESFSAIDKIAIESSLDQISSDIKIVENERDTSIKDNQLESSKLSCIEVSTSSETHSPVNGQEDTNNISASSTGEDTVIEKPLASKSIKTEKDIKSDSESLVPSNLISPGLHSTLNESSSGSSVKDSSANSTAEQRSTGITETKSGLHSADVSSLSSSKVDDTESASSMKEEISSVHRMLVTGSSEDGGTETELCSSSVRKLSSSSLDKNLGNVAHVSQEDESEPDHVATFSAEKQETAGFSTKEAELPPEKTIITTTVYSTDGKEPQINESTKPSDVVKTITTTVIKTFGEHPSTDIKTTEEIVPSTGEISHTDIEKTVKKSEIVSSGVQSLKREVSDAGRSGTPASDLASERELEMGGISTPHSDISSGQVSRAATHVWGESSEGRPDSRHCDSDDDVPCSPMSATSHLAQSPPQFDFDIHQHASKDSSLPAAMTGSLYGSLPDDPLEEYMKSKNLPVESQMYSSMYVSKYGDDDESEDEHKPVLSGSKILSGVQQTKTEDIDFETAIKEHRSVRGEDLTVKYTNGKSETTVNGKSSHGGTSTNGLSNGKSSQPDSLEYQVSQSSSAVSSTILSKAVPSLPVTETSSSSSSKPSVEEKKDPIEGWGKPLGLPPPPKNLIDSPLSQSTLTLVWNPADEWGIPLGLPSPAPPAVKKDSMNGEIDAEITSTSNKTTPKKVARRNAENNKSASNTLIGKEASNKSKHPESPVKRASNKDAKSKSISPVYMDLTYVPHHGNSNYTNVEFFKRIRARYYVFSGTEPSREVFNALLEAKQTWEDQDLEVTIIPTYDTDTLGYWVAENEDLLAKYKIDLSPSASRCTINLQDHETSCSAYRLEF
ncbi:microtubule-associated protein futsch [Macrosteles quadrilineatus]|uniref:microtubule-associated protein futsch n=1 Tax=Macrosteles quadrilineatus TaxID=74068 RepID=UPI0023E0FBB0|nr:microtubule-associated protein futsch [Macrosteles quadrilineatus]